MDETWTHIYDVEITERFKEWRHCGSPHPKKFKTEVIKQGLGLCLLGQR